MALAKGIVVAGLVITGIATAEKAYKTLRSLFDTLGIGHGQEFYGKNVGPVIHKNDCSITTASFYNAKKGVYKEVSEENKEDHHTGRCGTCKDSKRVYLCVDCRKYCIDF